MHDIQKNVQQLEESEKDGNCTSFTASLALVAYR